MNCPQPLRQFVTRSDQFEICSESGGRLRATAAVTMSVTPRSFHCNRPLPDNCRSAGCLHSCATCRRQTVTNATSWPMGPDSRSPARRRSQRIAALRHTGELQAALLRDYSALWDNRFESNRWAALLSGECGNRRSAAQLASQLCGIEIVRRNERPRARKRQLASPRQRGAMRVPSAVQTVIRACLPPAGPVVIPAAVYARTSALRPESALVDEVKMAHAVSFDLVAATSFRARGRSPIPSAPPPGRLPRAGE